MSTYDCYLPFLTQSILLDISFFEDMHSLYLFVLLVCCGLMSCCMWYVETCRVGSFFLMGRRDPNGFLECSVPAFLS